MSSQFLVMSIRPLFGLYRSGSQQVGRDDLLGVGWDLPNFANKAVSNATKIYFTSLSVKH